MGTIMERQKKDGAKSYTAVIRKKKGGKVVLTLSDTFQSRQAAERWMRKTERDLKGKDALERAVAAWHCKTWADVICDYNDASPEGFGKTKTANLAWLLPMSGRCGVADNMTAHHCRGALCCHCSGRRDCSLRS